MDSHIEVVKHPRATDDVLGLDGMCVDDSRSNAFA